MAFNRWCLDTWYPDSSGAYGDRICPSGGENATKILPLVLSNGQGGWIVETHAIEIAL